MSTSMSDSDLFDIGSSHLLSELGLPNFSLNNQQQQQEKFTPADDNHTYTLAGHNTPINAIRFNQINGLFASADDKGQLFIWDMSKSERMNISTARHHKGEILDLVWINETQILTASADSTAKIYDIEKGKTVCTFKHSISGAVNSVACSDHDANPQLFVTGGEDGKIKIWDRLFKDAPIHQIDTKYPICTVTCNSDMTLVFASGVNDTIYGFDLKAGKQFLKLSGHTDVVTSLVLSKDGSILTSYSADDTIRTWDIRPVVSEQRLANGRLLNKYQGSTKQSRGRQQLHRHRLITLPSTLTASKQFVGIVATSNDGNCVLFDLHRGADQVVVKLANHQGPVHDVDAWKQWLVSCGADGKIILGTLHL